MVAAERAAPQWRSNHVVLCPPTSTPGLTCLAVAHVLLDCRNECRSALRAHETFGTCCRTYPGVPGATQAAPSTGTQLLRAAGTLSARRLPSSTNACAARLVGGVLSASREAVSYFGAGRDRPLGYRPQRRHLP